MKKIKEFLRNSLRVIRVSSKPTSQEYWGSVKITGLGILVIGFVGFIIFLIFKSLGLFA